MNTIELQKIKIGLEMMLSDELLDPAVNLEKSNNYIKAKMRGYLWGDRLETKTYKYPRDWWQAIKEHFAPAWFLRRWPVEYTYIEVNAAVLYPDFRVKLPNEAHVLRTWIDKYDD